MLITFVKFIAYCSHSTLNPTVLSKVLKLTLYSTVLIISNVRTFDIVVGSYRKDNHLMSSPSYEKRMTFLAERSLNLTFFTWLM